MLLAESCQMIWFHVDFKQNKTFVVHKMNDYSFCSWWTNNITHCAEEAGGEKSKSNGENTEQAKARRKAEEKRASAEAKRGTKVARVLEIANLMKAVWRPPAKKSYF